MKQIFWIVIAPSILAILTYLGALLWLGAPFQRLDLWILGGILILNLALQLGIYRFLK